MSKLRNSHSEMFWKIIKHPKCNLKIVQNSWQILAMKFTFSKVTNSLIPTTFRSSGPQVFLRKGVLKICNKYTGEHPCRSVISIKLLCSFNEIPPRHGCNPPSSKFTAYFQNTFSYEHFWVAAKLTGSWY